jgi:hypothetical protein
VVRSLLPIAVAFALSGCAASQNVGENQTAPAQTAAAQPSDDAVCQSKGFVPGSDAYAQCRKNLDKQFYQSGGGTDWTPERDNVARNLLGRPPSGF